MDMDTKRKLIEMIKNHNELYNTTLSEYKDIATRNEAWNQIAEEMELSVEDCKTEWVKLRNCYVNALRRRVSLQNRVGRTLPPWLFESEMNFLKPFMTGRGYDDTPYTILLPQHPFNFDQDESIDEAKCKKSKEHTLVFDDDTIVFEGDEIEVKGKKRKRKLKTPKIEVDDDYEVLDTNDIIDTSEFRQRKSYQECISDMDESDLFFLGLSQTFKKLPSLDQCRLKMDIFKILNNAEMKQLESVRKIQRRSSSE